MPPRPIFQPPGTYPETTAPEWAQICGGIIFVLVIMGFIFGFALVVKSLLERASGFPETDTDPQAQADEDPQGLADEVRLLRARVQQLEADGTRLYYGSVATTEPSEARISPPPYAESERRKDSAVDS
ncbi:hypothetical protein MVEN_00855700 [Mycena venus]|uniref:Uncharacterized protein n=1 Tax=Mycena venus TaxID=2733690 RepID=A0A8H6YFK5_9AGAR|nr:hypothetical protein MVEN_00855700 [Mycena venus]